MGEAEKSTLYENQRYYGPMGWYEPLLGCQHFWHLDHYKTYLKAL